MPKTIVVKCRAEILHTWQSTKLKPHFLTAIKTSTRDPSPFESKIFCLLQLFNVLQWAEKNNWNYKTSPGRYLNKLAQMDRVVKAVLAGWLSSVREISIEVGTLCYDCTRCCWGHHCIVFSFSHPSMRKMPWSRKECREDFWGCCQDLRARAIGSG